MIWPSVGEIVAADGNRGALDLVGPAGVVPNAVDHQRNVGSPRVADRLAVVERFERRQFVGFFLKQIGELVHEDAAIAGVHPRPLAAVELGAGRFHRCVDVGLVALRHFGDDFFSRGMDRFKRLAARGGNPFAPDEALRLTNLRTGELFSHRGHCR